MLHKIGRKPAILRLKVWSLECPFFGDMCLAVPGKVLAVDQGDPAFRTATVDFCGVRRTIDLAFCPEAVPGDFVLVHVGYALSRIDEEEAARTFAYLAEVGALAEEGLAGT